MLQDAKKKTIIEKWRLYLYPHSKMSDEEIFDLFIAYAIDQEFEAVIKWEAKKNGKKV